MPKYFINEPSDKAEGQLLQLEGDTAYHLIKVLRVRIGEEVILCDGKETDYYCIVESIDSLTLTCLILSKHQCETEPKCKISLFQAMPKADKFEWVIQKSIELGVYEIIPIYTDHSIKKNANVERFQKIAESAAGQSMRGIIPKVHYPTSWEGVKYQTKFKYSIVAHEKEDLKTIKSVMNSPLKNNKLQDQVALWIGPEGGFSKNEITLMEEYEFQLVTLGPRILRSETAAIAAIAKILMETEGT
ncbi:MAG: 16S rRNA (uracil(1498)-N(3))-methyltransferase [Defluviitaleaceae bacterium]|nr:16S rRNA (uracil(1498)-N(3))-methyltransferase [Defluviitaleaceae bacterium]